jgi:hypothetical protein
MISPEEMEQVYENPELRDYVFGLPDQQALAVLHAAAKGDPAAAEQLAAIKKHRAFGGDISAALAKKRGETSMVGPNLGLLGDYRQSVPGAGLTPEQARRFVSLAQQM